MALLSVLFTVILISLPFESTARRFTVFGKLKGQQCWGSGTDILRDFVGGPRDCRQKCREFGDACVGFVRVNGPDTSPFEGKCYFRGDGLQTPYKYTGDDRDCYRPMTFRKHSGKQCWGTGPDILRDFVGDEKKCARKCAKLDGCVGFVRVNGPAHSPYAGKCYFRSGSLEKPYTYTSDDRDCFKPTRDSARYEDWDLEIDEEDWDQWEQEQQEQQLFANPALNALAVSVGLNGDNVVLVGIICVVFILCVSGLLLYRNKKKKGDEYTSLIGESTV